MDDLDRAILERLQKDARTANAEIARQVKLAPSAVFERIRKLEDRKVIQGYHARLDARVLELGQLAFVFVRADERAGAPATAAALAALPEVLELHLVAGEDCFLVKVRAADTEAIGRLLREKIGGIATVSSTRTTVVLQTVKESVALPVAGRATPEVRRK